MVNFRGSALVNFRLSKPTAQSMSFNPRPRTAGDAYLPGASNPRVFSTSFRGSSQKNPISIPILLSTFKKSFHPNDYPFSRTPPGFFVNFRFAQVFPFKAPRGLLDRTMFLLPGVQHDSSSSHQESRIANYPSRGQTPPKAGASNSSIAPDRQDTRTQSSGPSVHSSGRFSTHALIARILRQKPC